MNLLLPFLIACAFKVTLILTLGAALAWAVRRRSAALRHRVWAIGLLCTLLLPLLQLAIPQWHASAQGTVARLWRIAAPLAPAVPDPALPGTAVKASTAPAALPSQSAALILCVWAIGFALVLTRSLLGLARLSGIAERARPFEDAAFRDTLAGLSRELGIRRPIRLLVSADAKSMPCTWGFRQPRILLPADCSDWPALLRTVVLGHELAHIARFDWPLRVLAGFTLALFWFHPLVWLAVSQLRQQSERACDDAVLLSGVAPEGYAGEVLQLVRRAAAASNVWTPALAFARTRSHTQALERRLQAMLDRSIDRRHPSRRVALLTTITAILLLLPLAALRAPAQDTAGMFTGTVLDPTGIPVSNATIILAGVTARPRTMTTSDATGRFHFNAPRAGEYSMRVLKTGYADFLEPRLLLDAGVESARNVNLAEAETATPAPLAHPPSRIRVGGNVAAASLINKFAPSYPAAAKAAGLQGAVILDAVISADGAVESLSVSNPEIDPDLARAAVEAVSQWRYKPTLLNGNPVEVMTKVTVNFTLAP